MRQRLERNDVSVGFNPLRAALEGCEKNIKIFLPNKPGCKIVRSKPPYTEARCRGRVIRMHHTLPRRFCKKRRSTRLPYSDRWAVPKGRVAIAADDAIVAGYSLLQGFRCVSSVYMGTTLLSKPLGWVIFSCDQAMTYVTLAAAAAATEAAHLAKTGHDELEWVKVCYMGTRIKEDCEDLIIYAKLNI
eukprot:Gb_41333 [translate_table: standard]